MARPYSDDLRSRVGAAVLAGQTCREVAALFSISPASVARWSRQLRLHGTVQPKPMGGVRRAVLRDHRAWLLARLAAEPDLTLRGLQAELQERCVVVSHWAIWKLFVDEGISFKKKHSAVRAKPSRHRQSQALVAMAPDAS